MSALMKENPKARLVENRYRTLRHALYEEYQEIMDLISKDKMIEFLKDTIYLDRALRQLTEGIQTEEKKILSQEWCLKNDRLKI